MKKMVLLLAVAGSLWSVAYGHPDKKEHKLWCQQNWERCRQFKEEALKIRERHIARERECLQKARDFWAFEECKAQIKVQTRREMSELRQRFMEGAGR